MLMVIYLTSVQSFNDYAPDDDISRSQYTRASQTLIRAEVSANSYRAPDGALCRVFIERQIYFGRRLIDFVQTPVIRNLSIVREERLRRAMREPSSR